MLIDTHTHLYLEEFDLDRDIIIANAINAGVTKMVLPNIDSKSILPMMEMVKKYPKNCFPLIGLHPCSVKDGYKNDLYLMESQLKQNSFIGIGEIGLDLSWDKTFFNEQVEAFEGLS